MRSGNPSPKKIIFDPYQYSIHQLSLEGIRRGVQSLKRHEKIRLTPVSRFRANELGRFIMQVPPPEIKTTSDL